MKKTLLEIYALLICFGAIVCFSIWLGIGTYSLVGTFNPELTISSWIYERHQNNDRFWQEKQHSSNPFLANRENINTPATKRPSEEALTKTRLESYQQKLKIEVRNNKQSLLQTLIILIISIILFFIHWRLAKSVGSGTKNSVA